MYTLKKYREQHENYPDLLGQASLIGCEAKRVR